MPILDPSLQCFLIKSIKETEGEDGYSFILKYLLIASQNLNKNSSTIEKSIQFKRDFEANIPNINEEFGCNFTKAKLFGSSFQRNCYKYFYKHLKVKNKEEESKKIRGQFNVCNDKFNTRFFRPYIFHSKYHSWFFTDTPIAVLSIDSNLFSKFELSEEKQHQIQLMIKFEIDILSASGLLLILCINYTTVINEFLNKLIKDNQFSEIHCNIFNENDIKPFLTQVEIKSDFLRGYLYLYCQFVDKNTEEQLLMKKFKKNAHVAAILFSKSPNKSLIKLKFYPTQPFFHTKSGNQTKYLRIFLTYVPIFDKKSDSESFIPCDFSNLCLCYINSADFLIRKQTRVQILFDDEIDQHHHKIKYVNYDDIHKIRAVFFVDDTFSLTKLKETEIQRINRIRSNVIKKIDNGNKFRKDFLLNFLKIGNYEEFLKYVTYAYSHFIRSSIFDFAIHRAQIYAALDACETCFSVKSQSNSKGVIYQVDTGEGKSCIICLIAAILVLKNYTVHIASSNIKLSNRDYFNSYEFFKLLGIESAVLLHMNELPYNTHKGTNKNERDYEDEENQQKRLPLKDLYRYENDNFFKSNADYYFEVNTQKNEDLFKKSYPDKFFAPELFKNSSRMNFSVCGLDNDNNVNNQSKANVIFSTFVNFECFYLHLIEMCPGYIKPYFNNCGLLIDEADSFLIDEITNGTIVSREIRSNAKEILTFVYDQKEKGISAEKTFEELKKNSICSDLKLIDVKDMYKDIEIAKSKEYSDGAHYKVKEFEVRNNHRIRNFIRKTVKSTVNLSDTISDFIDQKLFNCVNDDDEEEDEEFNTRVSRTFKRVIPYDFKHKGIIEPNKEFGGFVQQFISIKESRKKDNENLIFKDISINYLYISHPIFTNLYPKICGFTGTIGNAEDKKIYKSYYQLSTKKIPRNKINLRINLPIILCKNIAERNNKILQEVLTFHKKEIPVLIIFQELTEIDIFQKLLFENGIKYFNVFNGIDQYVSPDKIVGIKRSISLGTNVCARGADILYRGKPLHVIVSFYSPNVRVMNQAFGRTARQGQSGTCRCICLISQYFSTYSNSKLIQLKKTVNEFEYKIEAQKKFIEYYKERYSWIFVYDFKIEKPKIPKNYIIKMRKARINVNRIAAYKYQYPICMSVKTFLEIQSQKIFSLFNCPNSKYTWILFQRYIREMILESWSLMIHKFEQKANLQIENNKNIEVYKIQLNKKIEKLHKQLSRYLPKKNRNIFSTFMFIHKKVVKKYEKSILDSFKNLKNAYLQFEETSYSLFQLGFKPYSILSHSGARINYNNINETNFIKDPELKYQKKMPDNKFSLISITERIDMIFNAIFQKISSTLGEKVFLKFFLRRTLAGCEFGICFDINLINSDQDLKNNKYCMIDKDPLLVFSVFLWSDVPLMAGVLIFILVYVIGLCSQITSWVESFPTQIPKDIIKQGAVSMIMLIVPEATGYFLGKIIDYLENILDEQIDKLLDNDKFIIEEMRKIFVGHEYEEAGDAFFEKISSILGGSIKVSKKMREMIKDSIQVPLLMKIGFILLLLLGTYVRSFLCSKDAIKHAESNAKAYDSTFDYEKSTTITKNNDSKSNLAEQKLDEIIQSEKIGIELTEISHIEEKDKEIIVSSFNNVSKTYYYKFKSLNLSKYELKSSDFEIDKNIFGKEICNVVYKPTNMIYKQHEYSFAQTNMINLVRILATNIHPAISTFFGYYIMDEKFYIILDSNPCNLLSDYIVKQNTKIEIPFLNLTEKLIIAYGLASALEFIHSHNIVFRDFKPAFVFLDSQFYPYLCEFEASIYVDDIDNCENTIGSPLYMPPELIYRSDNFNPFLCDVYAYGISLCQIITQEISFTTVNSIHQFLQKVKNGYRPQIPDSTPLKWRELIERCWDQDPIKRPTFTDICDILESSTFVNASINIVAFNDYKKIIKPYRPSK